MKNRRQKNICVIIALSLVILSCIFVETSKSVYAKTKNIIFAAKYKSDIVIKIL